MKKAFVKNIHNPHVWGPLLGAGFIYTASYDQKISDWSTGDFFIFRDDEAAEKYSSRLLEVLQVEAYASIFLPPSMPQDGDWNE
ncbi:MAG: hypothetical protein NDI69_01525 [Bacteriovoracaceae bacterium]|nr:hypothetical protein [Bacteriovoracaceae bacterium]